MDISEFNIGEYNKSFVEETKYYTKICGGRPCQYADECEKKGLILFCCIDDENGQLLYIKGRTGDRQFSFKNMCRRDYIPDGGYTKGNLEAFYQLGKFSFPDIIPPSIDVWIEELKEMGIYKEESEE